ncbi:MAG: hypothetical protein M3Y03_00745 [Verrucomicrobiota bacterium]|nr:hypothetical protein [Verrucomicrobiota bacterium]
MKFSISLALLTVFSLAACEIDEPPPRKRRPAPRYPTPPTSTQYPPTPQPFAQDGNTAPTNVPPPQPETSQEASAPAPSAPTSAPKGDYPYGVPVPGKPGFVRSPYSPDKMTDVRGYAPGTEVKDPYTQKIFLVP